MGERNTKNQKKKLFVQISIQIYIKYFLRTRIHTHIL